MKRDRTENLLNIGNAGRKVEERREEEKEGDRRGKTAGERGRERERERKRRRDSKLSKSEGKVLQSIDRLLPPHLREAPAMEPSPSLRCP